MVVDKVGLTSRPVLAPGAGQHRRRGHDRRVVIGDLAVMLADGGGCVSDLGILRCHALAATVTPPGH